MAAALAAHAGILVRLPVALGGEAEGANSTGLGIISLVSIVLGWVLLAALWWFVFRDREGRRRK